MWLDVGETEACMMDAMYQESGCGWRKEKQRTVWWTKCAKNQNVTGGRGDRGMYDGSNVSGVRMWLEVGETEDNMVDVLYPEPPCAWR